MGSRTISIKFPKGLIDLEQRVAIANRLKQDAEIDVVDWKELENTGSVLVDVKDVDVDEALVHRVIDLETDEGPACTWEE